MRSFPFLHSSDVVRARACGKGVRCHFETLIDVNIHTDLMEYEEDPDAPSLTEHQVHHKTSDEEMMMTVNFDVFETDTIGCTPG